MKRRLVVCSAPAAALGLAAMFAGASGKAEAMEDSPKAAFARVLAVPESEVSGFAAQPLAVWGTDDVLWWGITSVGGYPQPTLVSRRRAGAAVRTGKALRLPLGDQVQCLALLDLQGSPVTLNLIDPAGDPSRVQTGGTSPAKPAVLLRVRQRLDGGESRSTLVLVALQRDPVMVWNEIDSSVTSDGGGYRSHELALRRKSQSAPLALELGQSTLPGAGEDTQRPGPPLTLHFSFKGQQYQRDR